MLGLAVIASLLLPTRYQGVAKLTLDFESNALQDSLANVSAGIDANDIRLQTQIKVMESDALDWEVIRRLRLDQRPEAAHHLLEIGPAICVSAPNQSFDSITPECRGIMLKEFHRLLQVESLPRTQVIEISYRCRSSELAAKVVNTTVEVFQETAFQSKYKSTQNASQWIAGQIEEARKSAEDAEQKFITYQKQSGILGADEDHNVLTERLTALGQQWVTAEAERIVREARYRVSQTGDPEALVEMTAGGLLEVLHSEQTSAQTQYTQLSAKFGENYPRVIEAKTQLDDVTKRLNAEIARSNGTIESEYEAALHSEDLLRREFEEQKNQIYNTAEATSKMALLRSDIAASRELYEQLLKQTNQAGILAALRAMRTTVIDPAVAPYEPIEPHYGLMLLFGALGGALLGVGSCLLRENLDTTILTLHDARSTSAVQVLGVIPQAGNGKAGGRSQPVDASPLAVLEQTDAAAADAYRSVRTALLLSQPGASPAVILATSALPREGKTITCCNLGAVFAQNDHRVLLVDADLRTAGLSRALGIHTGGGLSAALAGEDPAQFYVTHHRLARLTILQAGMRPPQPPDLLDSERMRELIALWRQQFDRVIIDAPPLIGISDAVILSTLADTTMLVLRANQSQRKELTLALEILAGVNARVAGIVLNDVRGGIPLTYGTQGKNYDGYFEQR
jgi:capsular exopolysaccharide synthesis family protein